jgi:2-methylcitrate dehydratase PrpD
LALPPSLSAKVNAWLADVLDYEDIADGHPSATVVPAALAIAEHTNAGPKSFLTGVVAGYEAGLRMHDAIHASPDVYRRFAVYHAWHGFAAGAAAMGVCGGSEVTFRSALGHAAANTNVPIWYVQYGRPAHALKANYGQMALGGVDAALCAKQGIIGPFAMLSDPDRGFARMVGSDQFDPSLFSAGLGDAWRTRTTSFKAFPCCGFLHTTIDGIQRLVGLHRLSHDDVDRVTIRSFSTIPEWFSDNAPGSATDAQLSVQYVSAMALLSIEPGRNWYSRAKLSSQVVSQLMAKIDVLVDASADEAFWRDGQHMSSVEIRLIDGRSFALTVDFAPGHPKRPFTASDVVKKFLHNICGTSAEKHGDEVVEKVMNLERLGSTSELCHLLRADRA